MGVYTCVHLHDYASYCPCYRREEAVLQIKFPDTMLSQYGHGNNKVQMITAVNQ